MLGGYEKAIADIMKSWPHLPKEFTKWLASNSWWLVLIVVVPAIFNIVPMAGMVLTEAAFMMSSGLAATRMASVLVPVSAALLGGIVTVGIGAMAILPLKAMQKRGWDLLFLSATIGGGMSFIANVIIFSLSGMVGIVIGMVIAYYVLFEIRSYFVHTAKTAK